MNQKLIEAILRNWLVIATSKHATFFFQFLLQTNDFQEIVMRKHPAKVVSVVQSLKITVKAVKNQLRPSYGKKFKNAIKTWILEIRD